MTLPKVFIGSSGQQRHLADELAAILLAENEFQPVLWFDAFPAGSFILDALQAAAEDCDFAVFVFARDDAAEKKGQRVELPRDNVLFECGLFLARLERTRVLVIEEDGVDVLTDLGGFTTRRFSFRRSSELRSAELRVMLREVSKEWRKHPPRTREHGNRAASVDDSGLGFARTLTSVRANYSDLEARLHAYARRTDAEKASAVAADRKPVELDSLTACVATYGEALSLVQSRFWTTTFLNSGFWTDDTAKAEIVASNSEMTRRLALAGTQPRRIFLIDLSPADYADAEKERCIYLRRSRKLNELKQLNNKRKILKQNFLRMRREGCQVKVAYDRDELYKTFREQVDFDYWDSELAIYDDFRVDVYGGGRTGVINRVRSYTPMLQNFVQYKEAAVHYFEELWKLGEDIEAFLNRLERAELAAEHRIDYQPNWLAHYEFKLNAEDEQLKNLELAKVKEFVEKKNKACPVHRYLDIGTCTARYPIQLSELLGPEVQIIGIDDDSDCVQFARKNVLDSCPRAARISIEREDFTESELTFSALVDGQFDLITCMLGTLSHFGRSRSESFDDALQAALQRMHELLVPEGALLLGTWSDEACLAGDMLKIYSDNDCQLLSKWTPNRKELITRLQKAGFSARRASVDPGLRLDFWICLKQSGSLADLGTLPPVSRPSTV